MRYWFYSILNCSIGSQSSSTLPSARSRLRDGSAERPIVFKLIDNIVWMYIWLFILTRLQFLLSFLLKPYLYGGLTATRRSDSHRLAGCRIRLSCWKYTRLCWRVCLATSPVRALIILFKHVKRRSSVLRRLWINIVSFSWIGWFGQPACAYRYSRGTSTPPQLWRSSRSIHNDLFNRRFVQNLVMWFTPLWPLITALFSSTSWSIS